MADPTELPAIEDVLGPAVWAACKADQRHVLEGWLRKNAVSDMHATATKLEPSASLAKALDLDARHVRALTPQQLVFAYLNYLRSHFKTPDTTPIEATPAPVNVPSTKKRISLTQNETPVWSNHDFPPLNAPTTSTATVHIMASKPKVQKDKRRIRSTLVATPSLVSTPSSSSSSIFTSTPVEKSHLPSQMNNDVLSKFETRLTSVTNKPAPIQTTIAPRQPQDAPQHNHPVAASSSNNNSNNNHNKRNHDHEIPSEMYDEPAEELEPMVAPTPMALFYSFLFQAQLVPLAAHEVQWLFTLLHHDSSEAKEFALAVFYTIPETLELFGPEILKLAVDTFAALHVARSLQIRFLQYLEAYEEARSVASQAVGTSLPIEVVGHSARDFAVPFCEDTDSRLHFRSPAEAVLFSNREKARDAFLSLLRQWQSQRTSIEVCHVASLRNEMASVLDDVSANNLWWFAQFFVQELCQVGINPVGEHDVDLVEKIMHDDKLKNPDRLRKLHQRFTSQQAPKAKLGPSAHSTKFATNKGPSSSSTSSSSPSSSSSLHTSATASSDMAELFPENQLFFAQFLETTNHALFTRLVATVLEAQLFELEGSSSSSSSSSSIRKTFTLHALQARLLARFLAYVHVAPYVNSLGAPTNVAIERARKQAIDMRNRVRAPLDVCGALGRCVSEHTLMASLPWLLEYLRILILRDPIACATRYVQSAVAHVRALFFSPRLEGARSENGLLLRLQLEAFLQTASTRPSLQPSVLDSLPLHNSLTIALDAPLSGLDAIPYLASSMFLAHCVPDVPTLRAFLLQLQATLTQGPAKPTTTRRLKVRPLTLSLVLKNVDDDDDDHDVVAPSMADDDPLTRAFYKQYPSLQTTIEFVVDTSMTNVCQLVGPSVVVPSANAFMDTIALRLTHDETTAEKITAVVRRYVGQAKLDACTEAIAAAEPYCQEHIPRVLQSLLSPAMDARVKAMAVSLATQKALGTVRSVVAASMGMEFSKQVVQRVRKMAKPAPAVAATAPSLLDALHAAAKDAASSAACLDQYTSLLHLARAAETTSFVWCCVASVLHDERVWRLEAPASQKALLQHALRNHAWQPSAIALLEPLVRLWLRPDHIAAGRQHLETLCDAFPELQPRIYAIVRTALPQEPSSATSIPSWLGAVPRAVPC